VVVRNPSKHPRGKGPPHTGAIATRRRKPQRHNRQEIIKKANLKPKQSGNYDIANLSRCCNNRHTHTQIHTHNTTQSGRQKGGRKSTFVIPAQLNVVSWDPKTGKCLRWEVCAKRDWIAAFFPSSLVGAFWPVPVLEWGSSGWCPGWGWWWVAEFVGWMDRVWDGMGRGGEGEWTAWRG